jgi:hypothetical protein
MKRKIKFNLSYEKVNNDYLILFNTQISSFIIDKLKKRKLKKMKRLKKNKKQMKKSRKNLMKK